MSLVTAISVGTGAALGYDVIDVEHGATIEGTVSLEGAVPEPKGFNLIPFRIPNIVDGFRMAGAGGCCTISWSARTAG
jgi:hypothetical protein